MEKINITKGLGLLLGVTAVSAFAANGVDPYFDIKEVKVKETIETQLPEEVQQQIEAMPNYTYPVGGAPTTPGAPVTPGAPTLPGQPSLPGIFDQPKPQNPQEPSTSVVVNEIINLGERIWNLITKNHPVVNVNMVAANALPKGVSGWDSLGEWQMPLSRKYTVSYVNGFGSKVVDFDYRIIYTVGGNYKGVGKYIAQISTIPAQINVGWNYTFNAQTMVPNVVNVGTEAAPIAGAETSIRWEVITPIKHHMRTEAYFIRGDGQFASLND